MSEHYKPTEELRLPELFWDDLKNVLKLLVATASAEFEASKGQYTADKLLPLIQKVQQLLDGPGEWTPDTRAEIEVIQASTMVSVGEQVGDSEYLLRAITKYRYVLLTYTRARAPRDWAMTQNNLGTAMLRLGEHENSLGRLRAAFDCFQCALLEFTRERFPLDWAMTQANLGNALARLSELARQSMTRDRDGRD